MTRTVKKEADAVDANAMILSRVRDAAEAALDKKAKDLAVLDVGKLTSLADYFFICSAATERQADAISDAVEARLRERHHVKPTVVEGRRTGRWILMDYGDFVIHVFTEEWRRFYRLERLWGDAPNIAGDLVDRPSSAE